MWMKNFRTRKMQTVMIFLVVMLSSVLLTGAAGILLGMEKPFYDLAKNCNAPDAHFFSDSDEQGTSDISKKFEQLKEVKAVEMVKVHFCTEEVKGNGEKIDAFMRLAEYKDAVYSKIKYMEGSLSVGRNLKEKECLIPSCISVEKNLHVEDRITIGFPDGEEQYTIKGIYVSSYNTSTAMSSEMIVKKINPKYGIGYLLSIYANGDSTTNEIEDAYRSQNEGILNGLFYSLNESITQSLLAGKIIGAIFLAIGIIMLLVSILIIQFMIRNAMLADRDKIAIYKVMGYSSWDILKQYLMFYFVLTTAAVWAGIAGSILLANQVLKNIYQCLGSTRGPNIVLPGVVCYALIITLVLFVTWNIVARYERQKPVIALTGYLETGIKKRKNYKGNSSLAFSPFSIAYRTIVRDKRGIIGVLITCIVTIFAINFAVISLDVARGMKNQNDFWMGIDKSDVVITLTEDTKLGEICDVLKMDKRVIKFFPSSSNYGVNLKWVKGMGITSMNAELYEDFSTIDLPMAEGRNPSNENEIAIGTKVAAENQKEIGDYIEVYLTGDKKVNLLITGTYQTYNEFGSMCRMMTSTYIENGVPIQYTNISIYLKKGTNQSIYIADMKQEVGTLGTVIPRTELYATIMDMIATPQEKAVPPVILLVILLGCMNIFCIVMLRNRNNERTNGIYKCIGYSTFHLILANMYYVGLVGGASMIVALPAIIILYPEIMKMCLSMFHFQVYPVDYNWMHIIITNIGILVLFVVSTFLSSRTLKTVSARDLVKE